MSELTTHSNRLNRKLVRLVNLPDPLIAWGQYYLGTKTRFSRQTLLRLFDRIPEAVVITDNKGCYRAVNDAACRLLGYDRDRLLTLQVHDLVASPEEFHVLRNQQEGDFRFRRSDGVIGIAAFHTVPLNGPWNLTVLRDVTRQRADEDQLRILRAASASINDAIIITTPRIEGDPESPLILWCNTAFTRMTGYTLGEVVGRSPRLLQGGETSPETCARMREAINNWQPFCEEVLNYRKDGTSFWAELNIAPVADATGWFTHWVAVQRDITQRKQREDEKNGVALRFQKMVEALPHIAWIADANGVFIVVNQRWYELTGMTPGTPIDPFSGAEFTHPDDWPLCQKLLRELPSKTQPFELEYRLRCADGTYRWYLERSVPLWEDEGQVTQWVGTLTDIEERKRHEEALQRSEERYALAVDGTQDGIWDTDLETNYIYLSTRWKEMLGYTTPDEQTQVSSRRGAIFERIHPDDRDRVLAAINDHLDGKTQRYQAQFRLQHKDGSYRWIEARGKAMRRPDGTPYRFAGAHTDITDKKLAEQELENSRQFIDRILTISPDVYYIVDVTVFRNLFVNREIATILGYSPEEITKMDSGLVSLFHPDDWATMLETFAPQRNKMKDGEFAQVEYRMRHRDGTWRWLLSRETPFARDAEGRVIQVFGVAQDITSRKMAEEAKRISDERLILALEAAQEGIWDWNFIENTLVVTPSWLQALGYSAEEFTGTGDFVTALFHPEEKPLLDAIIKRLDSGESFFSMEIRLRHRQGHYIWLLARGRVVARKADGRVGRMIGSNLDITQRKEMEDSLLWRAQHDSLTELANRTYIHEWVTEDIQKQQSDHRLATVKGALLLLDLDGFKYVNDSLGHDTGDQVLILIARRLQEVFRKRVLDGGGSGCLARIGGDEFAVWLPNVSNPGTERSLVPTLASELLDVLAEPLRITLRSESVREILLTGSIGIAAFPLDGTDTETLFKNADTALYLAKESGRGRYRFHSPQRSQAVADRFRIETRLRSAVQHQELHLVYQPQIDLNSGHIISVEALARWNDAEIGVVPPATFIPIAEQTGLIHGLGDWTLNTACHQLRHWHQMIPHLRMAVNLSALQVVEPGIEGVILGCLDACELPGTALELELTETALIRSGERSTNHFLTEMRRHGVRLALDDFGTGYSSLSYLRSLPVDVVKIDRGFMTDLPNSPQTRAIVKAIIDLAHALGLTVTAEGVETEEQQDILRDLHCDYVQGYLLSRPVAPETLTGMLASKEFPLPRASSLIPLPQRDYSVATFT